MDLSNIGPKIKEMKVVQDFTEVFPMELFEILPDREMQFTIDLVPGTTPISKALYGTTHAELKELN